MIFQANQVIHRGEQYTLVSNYNSKHCNQLHEFTVELYKKQNVFYWTYTIVDPCSTLAVNNLDSIFVNLTGYNLTITEAASQSPGLTIDTWAFIKPEFKRCPNLYTFASPSTEISELVLVNRETTKLGTEIVSSI